MRRRADSSRWSRIKKIYGITKDRFNEMHQKQDGKCDICKKNLKDKSTHIDHNHKSGKVRGLLCNKCNQAIGLMHESKSIIKNSLAYLEKHEA